ncbi:MAG TPA: phosphate/phosphite/phosphonate ABC transporter substrate-binding protein [Gammaproteobacteria bacterium]|nr:phosphate/phosphite/phosphonate ABC transporter substrate-binding protein [Gammaproteobacteria bacterium]
MRPRSLQAALALCLLLFAAAAFAQAPRDYYRLGVLPLQSPTKLAAMFMPLADDLAKTLGRPVQFVTAPSFAAYMQRVQKREYDIIYLNPLLYTEARKYGYRAIAKVAQEPFTGILVVRKDGPIQRLDPKHLPDGLRIGFPDPNAFAATVMTRQYMRSLGIDVSKKFHIHYFRSQDSALMALYSGLVDITGTWRPSLRSMPGYVRAKLRIVAETPPQPQMPIAVRAGLPRPDVKRITDLLLRLGHGERGHAILKALGFEDGFVRATDAEYLGVRQ